MLFRLPRTPTWVFVSLSPLLLMLLMAESSFPFSSGSTNPTALAAPVEVGIIDSAADIKRSRSNQREQKVPIYRQILNAAKIVLVVSAKPVRECKHQVVDAFALLSMGQTRTCLPRLI